MILIPTEKINVLAVALSNLPPVAPCTDPNWQEMVILIGACVFFQRGRKE